MRIWFPLCLLTLLSVVFAGTIVSASSSVGSNPGLGSLPTTFDWEGDSVLNGDDVSSTITFDDSISSSLDAAEAAGMVMFSTSGIPANNSTSTNQTSTPPNQTSSDPNDALSGYASVGDIIQAQDWTALQKYTQSINATADIPDSQLTLNNGNRQSNWDTLFTAPSTCSGCS